MQGNGRERRSEHVIKIGRAPPLARRPGTPPLRLLTRTQHRPSYPLSRSRAARASDERTFSVRLLLVEDNLSLSDWLARVLRRHKYTVDCVHTGGDADHVLQVEDYNLVILDLALPELGGLEVLRRLRARRNTTPVLILTASDGLEARVEGLDNGADDYLAKPFDVEELEARVRALLRRATAITGPLLECGPLTFDSNARRFAVVGEELSLTAREHAVLEALVLRAGATVSKTALRQTVFGIEDDVNPKAIDLHIHRLRKKLAGSGIEIVTQRGLGYVLKDARVVS